MCDFGNLSSHFVQFAAAKFGRISSWAVIVSFPQFTFYSESRQGTREDKKCRVDVAEQTAAEGTKDA